MNANRLLIENLDYAITREHLEKIFSTYGDVNRVVVRRNRGFVEMMSPSEAKRAQENLDGENLWGRSLKINPMDDTIRFRLIYLLDRFFS
jgi:RNA recognition motif-containing protein